MLGIIQFLAVTNGILALAAVAIAQTLTSVVVLALSAVVVALTSNLTETK